MNTIYAKEKILKAIITKLDEDVSAKELCLLAQTVSELERNDVLKETMSHGFGFGGTAEEKKE